MNPAINVTFITFACSKDVHYAKALVASIRYFYPVAKIIAILDEDVSLRDSNQLARCAGVRVFHVRHLIRQHKLYLTGLLNKFNVLFLPDVEEALICDADSVLVGPVLEMFDMSKDFVALSGRTINLQDPAERKSFHKWAIDLDRIAALDPDFDQNGPIAYFQGSHFFLRPKMFPVEDLVRNLNNLSLRHGGNTLFRAGDQGFWNYVINRKYAPVGRFGLSNVTLGANEDPANYPEVSVGSVGAKAQTGWGFVHYVGFSRRYQLARHSFGDLLVFFTRQYYGGRTVQYWVDEFLRAFRRAGRAVRLKIGPVAKP
jgi:hypothetical protein